METTNADAGTNVSSGDLGHAVDKIKAEPLDIELEKLHPSFIIASVQTERINGKEDEQIDSTDVYIENEMTLSSHNALVKEELDGVSDDLQTYCRSSPPKLVAQEQIGIYKSEGHTIENSAKPTPHVMLKWQVHCNGNRIQRNSNLRCHPLKILLKGKTCFGYNTVHASVT